MSLGVCESIRLFLDFLDVRGGFPQACESTPPSLTREGRAHRANTQNAAQHRLSHGLACVSLHFISVEVSAINPVSGPCKGRLAGSRPLLPGSRHSRLAGQPRLALPTRAGSIVAETGGARTTAGYSVKEARPLWLPRPDRPQQDRPANASLHRQPRHGRGPRRPAARGRLLRSRDGAGAPWQTPRCRRVAAMAEAAGPGKAAGGLAILSR